MLNREEKRKVWKILRKLEKRIVLKISQKYNADHKVKKLPVYILVLCIIATEILKNDVSLREYKWMFENPEFQKHILKKNPKFKKGISFVAFHYRLNTVDYRVFKNLFELVRNEYNKLLRSGYKKYLLIPVDSTVVVYSNNVLKIGYETTGKGGKNQVKFTIGFNGEIPIWADCYTKRTYNSENVAIGQTVLAFENIKKMNENADKTTFIIDRGMQNRKIFDELTDRELHFVNRLNTKYRMDIQEEIIPNEGSKIKKEEIGYLQSTGHKCKTKHQYRVITFANEDNTEDIMVVTNIPRNDMSAEEIAEVYRKRWGIEVFFRFIKQTVNFSHFVNRSENGIKSVMYIKLICSILLQAFRILNNIKGYKDTKRALSLVILSNLAKLLSQRAPPLK